jgi:molecular chaperone GrpE
MLRAAADLENYRKRAEQEKKELEKYGAKSLVKDLLSTIDNLERAVEHADTSEEANILDGVNMVLNQIHDTFEKHGIEVFDAEGEPFDPELHEAIQQVETPDHESGTVVEQFQRGYTIHDRLLRPAMVAVAKKVEDDASETGEAADGGESDTRDGGESEAEVAEGDDGSETPESN